MRRLLGVEPHKLFLLLHLAFIDGFFAQGEVDSSVGRSSTPSSRTMVPTPPHEALIEVLELGTRNALHVERLESVDTLQIFVAGGRGDKLSGFL